MDLRKEANGEAAGRDIRGHDGRWGDGGRGGGGGGAAFFFSRELEEGKRLRVDFGKVRGLF